LVTVVDNYLNKHLPEGYQRPVGGKNKTSK
jgi:hypothetical protein